MNDEIEPNVFISHFKSYIKNNALSEEHSALISFVVELVEANYHPCSLMSKPALQTFKEITSIDLTVIKLKGISISEESTISSSEISKKKTPPSLESLIASITQNFNSQETTACVHYSYSLNASKNYAYANNVDHPTCSHPSPPHSSTCPYSLKQMKCPMFQADVKEETFVIEDYSYKIVYQRTIQAMMNIYIYDQDNLVNKLSYFIDKFRELSSEDINNEISSIINEHHSNSYSSGVKSSNFSFLQSEKEVSSVNSYISSLIS